jgi:FlaA1/EpsC-like NDP-sugar epimerase
MNNYNLKIEDIDYNKLLNRKQIIVDNIKTHEYLKNKKILISGGCGSIGSEIVKQLLYLEINNLIIVDNNECGIFYLKNDVKEYFKNNNVKFHLADILDLNRLDRIFINEKPEIIYHCAAYKHVPIMEDNPWESIKVNIIGTKNIADISIKYNVEKFLMISTDKAVNPTNVMGASKRVSEIYINNLNKYNITEFITTRFGNVLGSSGSVIPTFIKQINKYKKIDITHKDIIRYFMTIPEAAQLVLYASIIGKRGQILMFDMGEPVKIYDLAHNIIKNYTNNDIEINIIGLRAGEKLYEELLCDGENTIETDNDYIKISKHSDKIDYDLFLDNYNSLIETYKYLNPTELKNKLKQLVPEYKISYKI